MVDAKAKQKHQGTRIKWSCPVPGFQHETRSADTQVCRAYTDLWDRPPQAGFVIANALPAGYLPRPASSPLAKSQGKRVRKKHGC